MSSLHVQIHAYDCLDQVIFTVRIGRLGEDADGPLLWTTAVSDRIQGSGETDAHAWLQDLLVAIMERT